MTPSVMMCGGYYVNAEGRRYVVECFRAGNRLEAATILAVDPTPAAHASARALAQDIADRLNSTKGVN